jgi:hypothetical protein
MLYVHTRHDSYSTQFTPTRVSWIDPTLKPVFRSKEGGLTVKIRPKSPKMEKIKGTLCLCLKCVDWLCTVCWPSINRFRAAV